MKKYFFIPMVLFIAMVGKSQSLQFIMDMVHNNPGEAPFETKYNNPEYLKSQGFNSIVPRWFVSCAITYNDFNKKNISIKIMEKRWIDSTAAVIDKKIVVCKDAGINIYPFTDFLIFPISIWEKYGDSLIALEDLGADGRAKIKDNHKPDIRRQTTQQLLRVQIAKVFNRFPQLDGLVLRFGETYLHDVPFHTGGSPLRNEEQGIEDHITFLNILRDEICVKRNKKLFYRTWDFGYNFHNNPNYYLAVTNAIVPHPNLVFSIKYQQADFLRMTPFNPTLGIGKHQQIVESQSAMEAYGKGAHPYYAAYGVINGWPETKYEINFGDGAFTGKENNAANPRGVKDILYKKLLCGVNTWSKGGGWQGPYISNEFWNELNTYVVAKWAQDTSKTEEKIFYEFAAEKNIKGRQADMLRQIALLSIEAVRKGHCNSYTINQMWWARDEFFSVADNKEVINSIISNNLTDKVIAEKSEATAMWKQMEAISRQMTIADTALQNAIMVSCTYGRIKFELIEQMWKLMLANEDKEIRQSAANLKIKAIIQRYDELWNEWKALKKSSPHCATLYTDLRFRNQYEGSISELVNSMSSVN